MRADIGQVLDVDHRRAAFDTSAGNNGDMGIPAGLLQQRPGLWMQPGLAWRWRDRAEGAIDVEGEAEGSLLQDILQMHLISSHSFNAGRPVRSDYITIPFLCCQKILSLTAGETVDKAVVQVYYIVRKRDNLPSWRNGIRSR